MGGVNHVQASNEVNAIECSRGGDREAIVELSAKIAPGAWLVALTAVDEPVRNAKFVVTYDD